MPPELGLAALDILCGIPPPGAVAMAVGRQLDALLEGGTRSGEQE